MKTILGVAVADAKEAMQGTGQEIQAEQPPGDIELKAVVTSGKMKHACASAMQKFGPAHCDEWLPS